MIKDKNETVVVYTFRYMWKDKQDKLCVKFITDIEEAHIRFMEALKADENVVSALREYVSEVNFARLGLINEVKKEEKKEENGEEKNEEIS